MGGRIWLESEPGQRQHVPLHRALRTAAAGAGRACGRAVTEKLHDLRVLVVDDNATNRRILEETLSSPGACGPCWPRAEPQALAALERGGKERPSFRPGADRRPDAGYGRIHAGAQDQELAAPGRDAPDHAHLGGIARTARRDDNLACNADETGEALRLLAAIVAAIGAVRARAARARRSAVAPPRRPLRILLAEDDAVNQKLAVRLLEKRGHTVTVASSGRQVLELLDASGTRP